MHEPQLIARGATEPRVRGILYQGGMVRALLREVDPKTQTRRVMDRQKKYDFTDYTLFGQQGFDNGEWKAIEHAPDWPDGKEDQCRCPYASHRGDWLWVREAWRVDSQWDPLPPRDVPAYATVLYEADRLEREANPRPTLITPGRYRHARFMPRWASRILLEITELRIERLQDISEADAKAEGCDPLPWEHEHIDAAAGALIDWPLKSPTRPYANAYALLWESINGAGSWAANPWVWVVEFKRIAK